MQNQIAPTENAPIYVLTGTTKTHHVFTQYWHKTTVPIPHSRNEQVWSSTCKIENLSSTSNPSESLALLSEYTNLHTLKWSKPKLLTPDNTLVALIFYNEETNCLTYPHVEKWGFKLFTPPQKEANCAFAINPNHIFATLQAKAIYFLLTCTESQPTPEPEYRTKYQAFITLWPNIFEPEFQNLPNNETRTPSANYPRSLQDAAQIAANIATIKKQSNQSTTKGQANKQPQPTPPQEPILHYIPNQPTNSNPLLIPNISFRNTRNPTAKQLPTQPHHLFLHITPEGPHNKRREVFYAQPSTQPTTILAYPISPLKATVAILFCNLVDSQPYIVAINTHTATQNERNEFLAKYAQYLNAEQLHQFQQPTIELTPPQVATCQVTAKPEIEPKICEECLREFLPQRAFTKYCSSFCRIDHNSKLRKMSFEEKQESNHRRSVNSIGKSKRKPVTADMANFFNRYVICFPDGTYYRGPDRTETSLVHNADNRDHKHFAKTYPESMAQSIVNEFPVVFAGCTLEKVESDA